MPHAEVVALLESAVLIPGRLRTLYADPSRQGEELRRHLAECEECQREFRAWEAVDESLAAAAPETLRPRTEARDRVLATVLATGTRRGAPAAVAEEGAAVPASAAPPTAAAEPTAPGRAPAEPSAPRPALTVPVAPPAPPIRSATRAAASSAPQPAEPARPEAPPRPAEPARPGAAASGPRRRLRALAGRGDGDDGGGYRLLLAIAAAAVFIFVAGAALGGPLGLVPAQTDERDAVAAAELEKVVGRMADMLQDAGQITATLSDVDGEPAGAVVLSPGDFQLAVVTRALPPPGDGTRYECFIERAGIAYSVGYMKLAGATAYWAGPLPETVPVDAGVEGDRFVVALEDGADEPLLTAVF